MSDLIDREFAITRMRKNKVRNAERNIILATDEDEIIRWLKTLPSAEPEIIRCKDCKYAHLTDRGQCKYCDIWFPDEKCYMDGNYFCGSAERRTDE